MNPEQRELLRLAILRVLDARASDRFGLTQRALGTFLTMEGFRETTAGQLTSELQYLSDKNFVALVGRTISPENRCWRITAEGRDFIALNL